MAAWLGDSGSEIPSQNISRTLSLGNFAANIQKDVNYGSFEKDFSGNQVFNFGEKLDKRQVTFENEVSPKDRTTDKQGLSS